MRLEKIGDTQQLNVTGLEMGDTCFYDVTTVCGILETNVTTTREQRGGRDTLHIDFIEFSSDALLLGSEWMDPAVGGAPADGMPFRQESFYYPFDPEVTFQEREVNQGRINPDTYLVGAKYWGSYLQGQKKPMSVLTPLCMERRTFLFVRSVSDSKYFVTLDLSVQNILTSAVVLRAVPLLSLWLLCTSSNM